VKFAYADPPYLGASRKHYSDHPEHALYDTIDGHRQLIDRLVSEFPDGWALSMASKNLHPLLRLCPEDVRVMAWVKPFTTFFPNVPVAWAWEPVIVRGGRKRSKEEPTVRDYVVANSPAIRGKGFTGRKPDEFCYWLFSVLGMEPDDELVDIFPGSGAVGAAWDRWRAQRPLGLTA
jgi:hypothetical protein